jgi:4-hydroxy-tetrahydrodipicolinate reductase
MARLRVGLFGFGRTGQLVAREILNDPDLELAWVVRRSASPPNSSAGDLLGQPRYEGPLVTVDRFGEEVLRSAQAAVDVVIDFSGAAGVHAYQALADLGTRVVSAVSHYDETGHALLRRIASQTAVLHSPNITVGINFLMIAARAMRRLVPDADVAVLEEHFKEKADVSGTAVRIARALGLPPESPVHSIRAGGIIGRHEVIFGLPNQTVRLVHESIHRAAFGRGAIFAARWLRDQPAGLFTMEDAVRASMTAAVAGA